MSEGETYELTDHIPTAPNLPGHVVLSGDGDAALDALGLDMLLQAKECVHEFGDFHLALSGGNTPMPLYRRLEKNVQLLEFKCVEFVEDLMYGHLKKPSSP